VRIFLCGSYRRADAPTPLQVMMVVSHHRAAACRRRHTAFFTTILVLRGAPVLMIDAREGSPLQNAACCIALHTNSRLKHPAVCA